MGSMSYCLFRNTLDELERCCDALEDEIELSEPEYEAALNMIDLCEKISSYIPTKKEVDEN